MSVDVSGRRSWAGNQLNLAVGDFGYLSPRPGLGIKRGLGACQFAFGSNWVESNSWAKTKSGYAGLCARGDETDENGEVTYIKRGVDIWPAAIFKVGDNYHQDLLALQIIAIHKTIYELTATTAGVVEDLVKEDEGMEGQRFWRILLDFKDEGVTVGGNELCHWK
ncbi:hypothetical protein BY996DRAFT_6588555 [Phakopsora pachyrhizi]|nr:hypothetical protein BY996DRAFT_6588555 [Phakopsora pachyrhizi]